jgi:septum formation protein
MLTLRYPLILASGSPRRRQLLEQLGLAFSIEVRPTDEAFPPDMPVGEVAEFLARQKAESFTTEARRAIVLCADTVVIIDNDILNKPADAAEARRMLRWLSGRAHEVRTGVCLRSPAGLTSFTDVATVYFAPLTDAQIDYYIRVCQPFDKAGAYGAQDFMGLMGIERLEGSFYTVMGLPTHLVFNALRQFALPD